MSNDNANMAVWAKAYKTDPEYTKGYKGAGGFQGTAIASLYPVQKATELFGPMGEGWDFEIVDEQFIPGGPIIDKNTGAVLCNEQTHSMRIEVWAKYDGKTLKTRGYGLTPHITSNKYGVVTDHEAQKKSLTDALKGALKLWGFSADVYMGQHDDPEYVKHIGDQFSVEKADDKEAAQAKQQAEYAEWKTKATNALQTSVQFSELQGHYTSAIRRAARMDDNEFTRSVIAIWKERTEHFIENAADTAKLEAIYKAAAARAKELNDGAWKTTLNEKTTARKGELTEEKAA